MAFELTCWRAAEAGGGRRLVLIRTRLVSFALEPRLVVADASARVEVADSGNSRREVEAVERVDNSERRGEKL